MALSRTYGLKIAGSGSTGMAMAIETRISPDKVPPTVGPEGFELPATSRIEKKLYARRHGTIREPLLRVDKVWNLTLAQCRAPAP